MSASRTILSESGSPPVMFIPRDPLTPVPGTVQAGEIALLLSAYGCRCLAMEYGSTAIFG